jgi:hypothetical protein
MRAITTPRERTGFGFNQPMFESPAERKVCWTAEPANKTPCTSARAETNSDAERPDCVADDAVQYERVSIAKIP